MRACDFSMDSPFLIEHSDQEKPRATELFMRKYATRNAASVQYLNTALGESAREKRRWKLNAARLPSGKLVDSGETTGDDKYAISDTAYRTVLHLHKIHHNRRRCDSSLGNRTRGIDQSRRSATLYFPFFTRNCRAAWKSGHNFEAVSERYPAERSRSEEERG